MSGPAGPGRPSLPPPGSFFPSHFLCRSRGCQGAGERGLARGRRAELCAKQRGYRSGAAPACGRGLGPAAAAGTLGRGSPMDFSPGLAAAWALCLLAGKPGAKFLAERRFPWRALARAHRARLQFLGGTWGEAGGVGLPKGGGERSRGRRERSPPLLSSLLRFWGALQGRVSWGFLFAKAASARQPRRFPSLEGSRCPPPPAPIWFHAELEAAD